jgi:tetratricopeptide (TPR) repeat protein
MKTQRLELIKNMLENNPNDNFLNYAAALEFRKNGDLLKAIEIIENIIQKDQSYIAAYYQLGKLYEETNQNEKAIDIYKKGKKIAFEKNDQKTLGELTEALMIIDEEAFDY